MQHNDELDLADKLEFAEQDISHLKGRVDALENLCMLLIATHHQAEKITAVFKAKASEVAGLDNPTDHLKSYADGLTRLAYDLDPQKIIELLQNDEMKFIKSPQNRH